MGKSYYTDTYFDNDDTVLSVYDFDYATSIDFNYKLDLRNTMLCPFMIPCCWPCIPLIVCCICTEDKSDPWYEHVRDAAEAQHVALTRDGIRYVMERHKIGARSVGKVTKTIPLDMITDCDIQEPAGSSGPWCCMVPNVLSTVNIDTASGNRQGQLGRNRNAANNKKYELVLSGLKDPDQFQKDVWSLKRSIAAGTKYGGLGGTGAGPRPPGLVLLDSPYSTSTTAGGAADIRLLGGVEAPDSLEMYDRGITTTKVDAPTNRVSMAGNFSSFSPMTSQENNNKKSNNRETDVILLLLKEQNNLLQSQNEILQDILHKDAGASSSSMTHHQHHEQGPV